MPGLTAHELVARQAELAELDALIVGLSSDGRSPSQPGAVVLQGPAGIGKTALWQAGVRHAQALGVVVLQARPAEPETSYAYAALADMLRDQLASILGRLPAGQREALSIALGVTDAPASDEALPADRVQSVVTNALLQLASDAPVLLAIDDAQWLDLPSAAVVEFFARRIGNRPVGIVVTQRVDEESPSALGLDRALTDRRVARLWLEPLSLGALHKLLEQRLGMTLPRAHLLRLHELSGGVPFHALEIARALSRGRLPPIGAALPIPASLRELLAVRLERLPAQTRRVLLLVSLAGAISRPLLERLLERHTASADVTTLLDAGLLTSENALLRAAHPLISSTATSLAAPAQVRTAHAELARTVEEPEARARHRALAVEGTDEDLAAELEAAGHRTMERGAPDTAAELFRLASERTPPANVDARLQRKLELGKALFHSADTAAAAGVLDELLANAPAGRSLVRARAEMFRSEVAWYTDTAQAAVGHAMAGLTAAEGDPASLAELHYRLSIFYDFDVQKSFEHSRMAVALLEGLDRPSLLASALFIDFSNGIALGRRPDLETLKRALALEPVDSPDSTTIPGIWWTALDRTDDARRRFLHMLELDRRYGHLSSEPSLLTRLAEVELWADNYVAAREYADAASAAAQQEGASPTDPSRRIRALIDAHQGSLDGPRALAGSAAAQAEQEQDYIIAAAWLVVLAFIASSAERHEEVVGLGQRSARLFAAIGKVEPLRLGLGHELAESLAALGRIDQAEDALSGLRERQAVVAMPWRAAAIARTQAQILAAGGQVDAAIARTDSAVSAESRDWRRFDRARTLLLRGSLLRRARARRDSAMALDEATATFEEIGAPVWAARARTEAERLGRHRPGTESLTPSEQQVAELAAAGLTNREVAERLSVSPKTVEAHLARAYGKLGIRSRAELGRMMGPGRA